MPIATHIHIPLPVECTINQKEVTGLNSPVGKPMTDGKKIRALRPMFKVGSKQKKEQITTTNLQRQRVSIMVGMAKRRKKTHVEANLRVGNKTLKL